MVERQFFLRRCERLLLEKRRTCFRFRAMEADDPSATRMGGEEMMSEMKKAILLGAVLLPMLTFGVQVQTMPVCEYADTEVATNVPFRVSLDDMSRIEVSLSLSATLTNVAIIIW